MHFKTKYLATVRDATQQITRRVVFAFTLDMAIYELKAQQCRVISIEQRANPFWDALRKGKIEIGSPASKRELATFSNNLALMGLVCRYLADLQSVKEQWLVYYRAANR